MIVSRNRGWIGIDVGSHTVKLVQTVRQGGRVEIVEALVVRRSDAWSETLGDSTDTSSSAEEIGAGLSLANDFSGRSAAVALPMSLYDVRGCNIEAASETEARSQIVQELESALGDIEAEREFDFWITDDSKEQSLPENAMNASISRNWAQQVAQDMTAAGLVGQVLDSLPTALARAVEIGAPRCSQSPVIAVDWGYRRATFCEVYRGRPRFVRCLRDADFAAIPAALMKALTLTSEEAQKLLTERGVVSRDGQPSDELQAVIEEVTLDSLAVFIEELRRTLGFLRQQRRGVAPAKLILFGGGAATKHIEGLLAEHLEMEVVKWTLDSRPSASRARVPIELLGPAVALSSLAWSRA